MTNICVYLPEVQQHCAWSIQSHQVSENYTLPNESEEFSGQSSSITTWLTDKLNLTTTNRFIHEYCMNVKFNSHLNPLRWTELVSSCPSQSILKHMTSLNNHIIWLRGLTSLWTISATDLQAQNKQVLISSLEKCWRSLYTRAMTFSYAFDLCKTTLILGRSIN